MSRDSRESRIGVVAAAALAILALAFAGCGDDESNRTELLEQIRAAREQATESEEGQGEASEGTVPGAGNGEPGGGSPQRPSPSAPIQKVGTEAEGGERTAIVAGFHAYLDAFASGSYDVACMHLAEPIRQLLQRLGAKQGKDCPEALSGIPGKVKKEARRKANGKVRSVRVDGDRGHVIFSAPGAALYQMPMDREDGEWKVGLVSAPVLVPSR